MRMKHLYKLMPALAAALLICGCNFPEEKKSKGASLPGNAIIGNTDYSTGSISSIDLEKMTSSKDILKGSVDPDIRVRAYDGLVYILNNTNQNIQLVDPEDGFKTLAQISTGSYSYPHDLAVSGGRGYLSLCGSSSLWIINPSTLAKEKEIDLSAYNPSGAANPSMDQLWIDASAHRLYVSIGRITYSGSTSTADYSSVIVIDTLSDTVIKEIKLQWTISGTTTNALNPYSKFVFASKESWNNGDGHDHLFLLCCGFYNGAPTYSDKHDGGIVAIDTTDLECENGFLVTEGFLQEAISDFDYAGGKFYVAATGSGDSDLFAVQPYDAGKSSILHAAGGYNIPFVKVNGTGLLLAADRTAANPGIWIFNTADDSLKYASVISTGLPPADITLIE